MDFLNQMKQNLASITKLDQVDIPMIRDKIDEIEDYQIREEQKNLIEQSKVT
jgi:hypothetical protein